MALINQLEEILSPLKKKKFKIYKKIFNLERISDFLNISIKSATMIKSGCWKSSQHYLLPKSDQMKRHKTFICLAEIQGGTEDTINMSGKLKVPALNSLLILGINKHVTFRMLWGGNDKDGSAYHNKLLLQITSSISQQRNAITPIIIYLF